MSQHTKHLSFLFPVPATYFNSSVVVKKPFEINVHYTLDWRGVVKVERYTITPGMAKHIIKWDELEEELNKAAEHNALQFAERVEYEILRANRY